MSFVLAAGYRLLSDPFGQKMQKGGLIASRCKMSAPAPVHDEHDEEGKKKSLLAKVTPILDLMADVCHRIRGSNRPN